MELDGSGMVLPGRVLYVQGVMSILGARGLPRTGHPRHAVRGGPLRVWREREEDRMAEEHRDVAVARRTTVPQAAQTSYSMDLYME